MKTKTPRKRALPKFPRRTWTINPFPRVKESGRIYRRTIARRAERLVSHEEE